MNVRVLAIAVTTLSVTACSTTTTSPRLGAAKRASSDLPHLRGRKCSTGAAVGSQVVRCSRSSGMEYVRKQSTSVKALAAGIAIVLGAFAFARIPIASHKTPPAPLTAPNGGMPVAPGTGLASVEGVQGAPQMKMMVHVPSSVASKESAARTGVPRLARSGAVDLIASDVERALTDIATITRGNGGDLIGLNDERPANAGDLHRASVTLSVPAADFDRTLSALSGVARMRSRRVDAEDVSDKLVDDGARLRNLRRTELDLLKIMDRSGRVSEVLDVERELSSTRDQIEQLAAELADTQRRVVRSLIDVTLTEDAPVRPVNPAVRAQIAGAWHSALDLLGSFTLAAIARAFVVLAFAPYIVAVILIALAVRAMLRRRLRAPASA